MSVLIYCSLKGENGDLKIVYKCPLFYIVVKSEDDHLKNIFKCPSKFVGVLIVQVVKKMSIEGIIMYGPSKSRKSVIFARKNTI